MKIFVTGTRGIPNIPGGVETHCQHLYPLIVAQGYEVRLSRRAPYIKDSLSEWSGVELVDVYTPSKKSLEAIVHTYLSIWQAKKWQADVVHIHSVGPGLAIPFARLLGLRVVMTNHGPDYDRQKWGGAAKRALKLGEYLGGKFANEVIVISRHIQGIVKRRCGRDSVLIPNGVELPELTQATDFIDENGLMSGQYMLAVARFVPEKGLHDLIDAYESARFPWKLVLAGDADHEDAYSRELKQRAACNPNIVMTGYITGDDLIQVFTHAGLFVMPSYHEGLPIALLEAMSYGLPVLVSDIPANLEVALGDGAYFECGNIDQLSEKLKQKIFFDVAAFDKEKSLTILRERHNWVKIATSTVRIYECIMS